MTATEAARRYTPEDLVKLNDDGRFELIDGKLIDCFASPLGSIVSGFVMSRLSNHVQAEEGHIFGPGLNYRCFPFDPDRVRLSSGSFIRAGRISNEEWDADFMTVVPDLVVEVVSRDDLASRLHAKINDYLHVGVKRIWVVDATTQNVIIHRQDGTGRWLHEDDELTGEDVLPSFRCAVRDLFPKLNVGE